MIRSQATWVLCYAYLAYVFLSESPQLSSLPYFSIQAAFILLVFVYIFASFVNWGVKAASKYLVIVWLTSYAIEYIGVSTGLPFGHYVYTAAMGQFLGPVPIFIPFLWCALGYFCLMACGPSIVAPALLMTLLDLSLDPLFAQSLWTWQSTMGPQYFGVPMLNFLGWFITSAVAFTLVRAVIRWNVGSPRRGIVFAGGTAEAVGFYFLFGVSTILYQLYSGIPLAAAASGSLYVIAFILLWKMRAKGENRPSWVERMMTRSELRALPPSVLRESPGR